METRKYSHASFRDHEAAAKQATDPHFSPIDEALHALLAARQAYTYRHMPNAIGRAREAMEYAEQAVAAARRWVYALTESDGRPHAEAAQEARDFADAACNAAAEASAFSSGQHHFTTHLNERDAARRAV